MYPNKVNSLHISKFQIISPEKNTGNIKIGGMKRSINVPQIHFIFLIILYIGKCLQRQFGEVPLQGWN